MRRCPRFNVCSIPKCPLDEFMGERVELLEDEICPLRRKTELMRRSKRTKAVLSATMKCLLDNVPNKNLKKAKTV
jgi:hypothetical protein